MGFLDFLRKTKPVRTTRLVVERYTGVRKCPPDSAYTEESYDEQHLIEETLVNDKVVWRRTIDKEEIPANAWAGFAVGDSGGWVSRFKDVIEAQRKRAIAAELKSMGLAPDAGKEAGVAADAPSPSGSPRP